MRINALIAAFVIVATSVASNGHTIELTDIDADRLAVIGPEARMGWLGYEVTPGQFTTEHIGLRPRAALLIRVPLDKIPPNSRIKKAEWAVGVTWTSVPEANLYVWRLIGDSGAGACYQYRTTRPQPVEWTEPGAHGISSDRREKPSVVVPCKIGEVTLNVTEDVELWYSGAIPNNGWMFTVEDEVQMQLVPPAFTSRGSWRLRITYEPK